MFFKECTNARSLSKDILLGMISFKFIREIQTTTGGGFKRGEVGEVSSANMKYYYYFSKQKRQYKEY